eukprot:scaffold229302_cov61-Cyclotella_meneghiniana.AAC.1
MSEKANSTRLPPRTQLSRKQPVNRISKKAKKALMEKEQKQKEELALKLNEHSESLVGILESGGVPNDLCKLDEITSLEQGCNAIAQSFSYVQRRLQAIQADSKADSTSLLSAEEVSSQMEGIFTKCSVSAYKIRALKRVISEPMVDPMRDER